MPHLLQSANLHLAHELAAKGVDDAGHRRSLPLADEVEIEHALHSSWLETAVHRHVRKVANVAIFREPYYTKHRVFAWKSMWSAGGLNGLEGGAKRRMLSLADGLLSEPLTPLAFEPLVVGT